jgi:hypothetical protein
MPIDLPGLRCCDGERSCEWKPVMLDGDGEGERDVDGLVMCQVDHRRPAEIAAAKEIAPPRLLRRKARVPDGDSEDALEPVQAPALGSVQHEVAIDKALRFGIHGDRAVAVNGHEKIRPLDVGAVRGGHGERRLIEKQVGDARAIQPVLQRALPALAHLQAPQTKLGTGAPTASAQRARAQHERKSARRPGKPDGPVLR